MRKEERIHQESGGIVQRVALVANGEYNKVYDHLQVQPPERRMEQLNKQAFYFFAG